MTVLVFDVGGTRLKAGLVGPDGIRPKAVVPTDVSSADALIEQIVALGGQLLHGKRPSAVGVGIKGIVDPRHGNVVEVNGPLDHLSGVPLAGWLANIFGVPVCVENDARMYALGELHHGAGRGVENLVCLTLGTGIGVGVVTEGRLLRGGRGALGALAGHITVDVDGPPCTCGSVGCLEALIGSHGLIADARARACDHPGSRLATEVLDPEAIFSAAADGDAAALATVERFTHVLACGVVSLIHVYDPDLFVLGGGLAASAPQFLEQVQQFVDEHAWTQPKGRVRLALSTLGDTAALLGAAELAASAAEAS
ncbi:MAG: ROK family protein [Gaiellaceae bacterium]